MTCSVLAFRLDYQQLAGGRPPPNQQPSDEHAQSDDDGNTGLELPIQSSEADQLPKSDLQTKIDELQDLIAGLLGIQDAKTHEMHQAGLNHVQNFQLVWQRFSNIYQVLGGTGVLPK